METQHSGILAIWHDIVPEHAADVFAWYNREHHFERLDVPGFLNVRRYRAVQGSPELFIRYETKDVGVLSSEIYLARLNNPTPWTLQSQPQFRNNSRTVCLRKSSIGYAEGGFVVTIRIEASAGDGDPAAWDWAAVAEVLVNKPGIVGAELWEADRERSTIATKEKQLRGGEDHYVASVVVVHATDHASAEQALRSLQANLPDPVRAATQSAIYSLTFFAQNPSL
jgi:hypothetical protein